MVKLYDRTIKLMKNIADQNIDTCPDYYKNKILILEARSILEEINKL